MGVPRPIGRRHLSGGQPAGLSRPDYPLAHLAEQVANGYNDTSTLQVFSALAFTVDWRPAVVISAAAIAFLVWRRAGPLALLPLIYLATVPFEYLTKEVIHQPWPVPEAVQQPSVALAQFALLQEPQSVCPPALSLFRSQLIANTCQDGSFLSGGAARAVIIAGVVIWWLHLQRDWGPGRYLLALLPVVYVGAVGVGRVYMRWHWPSDIVAGYLLGGICLCAAWLLARPAPPEDDGSGLLGACPVNVGSGESVLIRTGIRRTSGD